MTTGKKKENANVSFSINMDVVGETDYGEGAKNIYALDSAKVLDIAFLSRFVGM